jgi:hypothetical protein
VVVPGNIRPERWFSADDREEGLDMDPWILGAFLLAAVWLIQIVLFLATFVAFDRSSWS